MAAPWLPLVVGGSSLIGSLINAIDTGGPDIDKQRVRATLVNPFATPAAEAGRQAAGRITGDPNYLDQAMSRQEVMRQQQDRYLGDLKGYAMGERSLAQEQMRREQERLQQGIMGEAASARGDFGSLAGRRAAPMQSSLIGARMVAPTQAMMQDEQQRAMDAYRQALAAQGQQDFGEMGLQGEIQRTDRGGLLYGQERAQYGVGQANTAKKQDADWTLNDEQYND